MSLANNLSSNFVEVNVWQETKKQFHYKCNAYAKMFSLVIVYQLLVSLLPMLLLFSQDYSYSGNYWLDLQTENASTTGSAVVFTLIWAFVMGLMLTYKGGKLTVLGFVRDSRTNHYANGLFILLLAAIGGVTAWLAEYLLQTMIVLKYGVESFQYFNILTLADVLLTGLTAVLYVLLFCVLGYFIGEMFQFMKYLVITMLVLFVFLGIDVGVPVVNFYLMEANIILFTLKIIGTSAVLYLLAWLPTRRMEVR